MLASGVEQGNAIRADDSRPLLVGGTRRSASRSSYSARAHRFPTDPSSVFVRARRRPTHTASRAVRAHATHRTASAGHRRFHPLKPSSFWTYPRMAVGRWGEKQVELGPALEHQLAAGSRVEPGPFL